MRRLKRPWRCEHWLTSEETAECEKHGKYTRLVLKGPDVRGETIKRVSGCPICIANELDQVQEALRILKVHELLDKAGIARRFQNCEFENYQAVNADAQRNLEACRRYAGSWEKCLAAGTSMIMIGNCGTGKNHLAVSMAKNIIRHHLATVEITDVMRLTRAVKNTWRHNSERTEDEVIDHFVSLDLLIIDEVGVQFGTPTEIVERIECRNQGLEKSRTLMTGIDELDAKTGGMEPGDLVFIAARPSMGKTELALDIIDKVTEQGHGVLLFTMEMANIQIGERMVSAAGGMPVSRLKSVAHFEDEDWARFSQGVGRMTGRNIWMVDQANLTIDEICATAKHHLIKHPETALVVVDYLGLIKTRTTGRHDLAVGEISKGLKGLAKSGGFPLIALSQLSRGVESRPNKRPMNSDLKNSGEIEADADIILMLYRDEVYNPDTQARGIAEINITKQRNGSLGTIYRRFYNGHFLPVDQESAQILSTPMQQPQPRRYSNKRTDSSKMERFF